jgi:hypothetical protein
MIKTSSGLSRAVILLMVAAIAMPASADDDDPPIHERTVAPPNARYEIAQSAVMMRLTFRLDRYTGKIDQLVKSSDEMLGWEPMLVVGLPEKTGNRPRFQLFMSGTLARVTLLLDSDTGKTWMLTKIKNEDGEASDLTWLLMPEFTP